MRRYFILFFCVFICFAIFFTSQGTDIYAAEADNTIQPRYTHISSISINLSVSGGTASYKVTAYGYDTVTRFAITAYLQYRDADSSDSWDTYDTAYGSGGQVYVFLNSVDDVPSGYEYRVKAVVTAVTSSYPETVTVYSEIKP